MSLETVKKYFEDHPECKDEVDRAYFAYHSDIYNSKAHNFESQKRDAKCIWCGRTRELVRWQLDLPYACQKRPTVEYISNIILGEEERYLKLLESAKTKVPKLLKDLEINGTNLCMLFHTYGYDIDLISDYVTITPELEKEYEIAMEIERERSRNSSKFKEVNV